MKLTKAQIACLSILAQQSTEPFGGWCNYGTGCGVKKNVVFALVARGLAQTHESQNGVSARITEAGRAALSQAKEGKNG